MTIYYVDPAKADDTGDGLAFATAKKTIAALTVTAGDSIRVAKSPADTVLSGTLSWTAGATTVNTSADLTGSLAAKDYIAKSTDHSEGYWEVASLTSTVITLVNTYAGATAATVANCVKLGFFDVGSVAAQTTEVYPTPTANGTTGSHITLTGGYDTSSVTRTGRTNFKGTGASVNGFGLAIHGSYWDVSYLGFYRMDRNYRPSATTMTDNTVDHCFACGNASFQFHAGTSTRIRYQNCVASGSGQGYEISGSYNSVYASNATIRSNIAVNLNPGSFSMIDACTLAAPGTGFGVQLGSNTNYGCVIRGTTFTRCNTAVGSSSTGQVAGLELHQCTFTSNTKDVNIGSATSRSTATFFDCNISTITMFGVAGFEPWGGVEGTYRRYSDFALVLSNTAQARAGTCVEVQPSIGTTIPVTDLAYCHEERFPFPVDGGVAKTPSIYLMKSAGFDGTVKLGIRWRGEFVAASPATASVTTSWVQYTHASWTPPATGVAELVVQVTGSTGSVYLDDIAT